MFNLTRQEQLVILFLTGILLVGIGVKHYINRQQSVEIAPPVGVPNQQNQQFATSTATSNTYSIQTIIVDIAGAVNKPGVYHLPAGSRIYDAITTAGDTTKQADVSEINLAAVIQDGDKIAIPKLQNNPEQAQEQTANGDHQEDQPLTRPAPKIKPAPGTSPQTHNSGKININTASETELDTLPGIGSKLAQRIILYRQQHGSFKRIDDVILVSGIGPKRLEQIKGLITVR